jgi:PTS system cellobiose-specific IIC component
MGGSGTTIALLIGIFISSKRKQMREIANLGFAPGLFNINEPVMFGMPIVLNPILMIPFIFGPVILAGFSYAVIAAGIFPKTIALMPWTTPPIIGGFLATGSIMGSVLQIINLSLAIVFYVPFILIGEKLESKAAGKESKVA